MGPSIRHLTDEGFLVPLRYFAPSEPDLSKLRLNKDGDYTETGLSKRMDTPQLVGDVVDTWMRIARHRSTVGFFVNRAHTPHVRPEFLAEGLRPGQCDGGPP